MRYEDDLLLGYDGSYEQAEDDWYADAMEESRHEPENWNWEDEA